MDHEAVAPLISARTRIEESMNELREKLSILSKKREAIQTAIDVLRSSDAELREMVAAPRKQKVYSFDTASVEDHIIKYLGSGPKSKPEIMADLNKEGKIFSISGLTNILLTNPHITKTGERDKTRYQLNGA